MAFTVHPYSYYENQFNNLVDVPSPSAASTPTYNRYADPVWQQDYLESLTGSPSAQEPTQRSVMTRALDLLSTPLYATAGLVKGLVDNNSSDNISPIQGFVQGLEAGNPFGPGNPQARYTYGKVLEAAGWQPTTLYGKIAKGVAGLGLDVLLDPTTYLSGGTSAILKGTGLAGKAAKSLEALGHDSEIMKYVGQKAANQAYTTAFRATGDGIQAENAANQVFQEVIHQPITQMTPDMAEAIVVKRAKDANLDLAPEQIAKDSQTLSKQYNKVIGVRTNPTDLTWGLKNLPFSQKLFGWTGLSDKSTTLATGQALQNLSDNLHIAQMYSGIRDTIYGSKIGELFSTTSPLYRVAHEDPSNLFDVLKFQDYVHGLNVDKLSADRLVRDKATEMGLSPAESKEVLNLLEDKTVWGKVKAAVNITETPQAQVIKQKLVNARQVLNEQLSSMQNEKNALDNLRHAHEQGLLDAHDQIDALQNELHTKLTQLDSTHLTNRQDIENHVKMLNDEMERVKAQNPIPETKTTAQDVLQAHNTWQQQLKKVKAYHDLQNTVKTTEMNSEEWVKAQDDLTKFNGAPNQSAKVDTIDRLSEYVFGKPGAILHTAYQSDVDGAVELIKKGASPDEVRDFIETRPAMLDPNKQMIYSHLGEVFGYGQGKQFTNWKQVYDNKIQPIAESIKNGEPVTQHELQTWHDWSQQSLQRSVLKAKLEKMDDSELKSYLTNYANQKMLNDLGGVEHLFNTTAHARSVPTSEQRMLNENMIQANSTGRSTVDVTPEQLFRSTAGHTDIYNQDALMTAIASRIPKESMDTPFAAKWVQSVADEANQLSSDMGRRFVDMTPPQKRLVVDTAISNEYKRATGQAVKGLGDHDTMRQALVKEARSRQEADRINAIQKNVQIGTEIHYIPGGSGRPIRGVVNAMKHDDQGKLAYVVNNVKDGTQTEVPIGDVAGVLRQNRTRTAEQLMAESPATVQTTAAFDELNKKLEATKARLSASNASHAAQRDSLVQTYQSRISGVQKHIQDLEMDTMQFNQAQYDANIAGMESLAKRIQKYDDVLGSDDAFETYLRNKLGMKDETPKDTEDVGEVYLNPSLNVSEKVRRITTELRKSFIEMGQEEVKIGKLSQEQLDNLTTDYVAHILTPYGEKFFSKDANIQKAGLPLTQDLGYGRKWNPFQQSRRVHDLEIDGATVHNPTVQQMNDYFGQFTHGNKVFQDKTSDLWVARALKHNELMYDDAYMHNMLTHFSKPLGKDFTPEKGYKAVMNHGMMRESLHTLADIRLSLTESKAISEYLSDPNIIDAIKADAVTRDIPESQAFSEEVKRFLDREFPADKRNELYQGFVKEGAERVGITDQFLNKSATPMVEFTPEQARNFHDYHQEVLSDLRENIKGNYTRFRKRLQIQYPKATPEQIKTLMQESGTIQRSLRNLDLIQKKGTPQMMQVNDVIVQKANQARKLQIAKDTNRFLQLFDKFTAVNKLGMTTITPAFHMRNMMSNGFLNWLGVGSDALNPKTKLLATRTVMHDGDAAKSPTAWWTITTPDGKQENLTWSDLYKMAQNYRVVDSGMFMKDMRIGSSDAKMGIFPVRPSLDPTDTKNFAPYKWGAKAGSIVENTDRLIHFASMLRQGHTPEEAAESATKFLFDYSDLTGFEQNVMKRIIPFYTWLRKNTRLQVSQYLEQPGKYQITGKVFNEITGMNNQADQIDFNIMPPYARDDLQLPFTVMINHVNRPVLWSPQVLPLNNFNDLPNPSEPLAYLQQEVNNLTPFITMPIEQALNYSFYLGRPIAQVRADAQGNIISSPLLQQRASNLATMNSGLNDILKLNTTDANQFAFNLFNDFAGIKLFPFDYQTLKKQYTQQLMQKTPQ